MMQQFFHVHRYGPADAQGDQRWFFRFSLPSLVKSTHRGRPAASAKAFCAERTFQGDSKVFLRAEDCALECDIWKLILTRMYGIKGLTWSHGSYEEFAAAVRAKNGMEVEEYIQSSAARSVELTEFLKLYDDILFQHLNCAESGAWNPDLELHNVRKQIENICNGAEGDLNAAHARKEWAVKWKDHCNLLADVEAYKLTRLEYEVNVKVDSLTKLWNAVAHFKRPEGFVHRKFIVWIESIEADREKLKKLLEDYKASQKLFAGFKEELTKTTEELKKSRP